MPTASASAAELSAPPEGRRWCLCQPCVSQKYHHSAKNYKAHHTSTHSECTLESCPYLKELHGLEVRHSTDFRQVTCTDDTNTKELQSATVATAESVARNLDLQKQASVLQTALVASRAELARLTCDSDPNTDHVTVMLEYLTKHHPAQLIAAAQKLIATQSSAVHQ